MRRKACSQAGLSLSRRSAICCSCCRGKLWRPQVEDQRRAAGRPPMVYALSLPSTAPPGPISAAWPGGRAWPRIHGDLYRADPDVHARHADPPAHRRARQTEKITSGADFVAARYGKNPIVGLLVTIIYLVGIIPYIALQLKAVSSSVAAVMDPSAYGIGTGNLYFIDLPLIVAFLAWLASPSYSGPATQMPPNTRMA